MKGVVARTKETRPTRSLSILHTPKSKFPNLAVEDIPDDSEPRHFFQAYEVLSLTAMVNRN